MSSSSSAAAEPRDEELKLLVAAKSHLGSKALNHKMAEYVWRRTLEGIQILNVGKTYEKIQLAARIIVTIENPADVIAISSRPHGHRPVLKYAHYTGAQAIAGRYTPGTFTNQLTKQYKEPRLIIVADPRVDHQPIREASYANIPVIALCDSDSPLEYVDCAIPGNNKGIHSIGVLFYLLAQEVQRLRGAIDRTRPWGVPVDLFFYRDPEELKELEESEKAAAAGGGADSAEGSNSAAGAYDASAVAAPSYSAVDGAYASSGFEASSDLAATGGQWTTGGGDWPQPVAENTYYTTS